MARHGGVIKRMQSSKENPGLDGAAHSAGSLITPRSDFIAALGWIAFGIAGAIGSWQMDRLENQDVAPYAVPGLLPFFLGLAIGNWICFIAVPLAAVSVIGLIYEYQRGNFGH